MTTDLEQRLYELEQTVARLTARVEELERGARWNARLSRTMARAYNGGCCPRKGDPGGGGPFGALPIDDEWKADHHFMLGSFCYDVLRRVQYQYEALTATSEEELRALDERIERDRAALEKTASWREDARAVERITLENRRSLEETLARRRQ